MANIRSAYAECSAAVLTGSSDDSNVTLNDDGDASMNVTLTQKQANWQTANADTLKIASVDLSSIPTSGTVTVTVTHDGKTTIGAAK